MKKLINITMTMLLVCLCVSATGLIDQPFDAQANGVSATRMLPGPVGLGAQFDVTVDVTGCEFFGQLTETLPDGFTYVSISDPELFDIQIDGQDVQITFLSDTPSITYQVQAPAINACDEFSGVIACDSPETYNVGGNAHIEVGSACQAYDIDAVAGVGFDEMVTALMDYLSADLSFKCMITVLMCYLVG